MNRQIKVGLTVLAAIVLLYLLVSWSKNSGLFAGRYSEYRIFFKNINGLKTSDPVTLFGYNVGSVSQISVSDSGMIITVRVSPETKLYADASAKLLLKEIMGSKQVELLPGTPAKGLLSENTLLKGEPTFDFTTAMDQIGQVFQKIKPETISNSIENLEKISARLAELTDSAETMKIKSIIEKLRSSLTKAEKLLTDADEKQLIARIAEVTSKISKLSSEAEKTLADIHDLKLGADTLLPKISDLTDRIRFAVIRADSTVASIKSTLDELKNKKSLVGKLLYDEKFAFRIDSSLAELDSTLNHFRTKSILVKMVLKRVQ